MISLNNYITNILESQAINEGGSGGHMDHVFNIPWVKTGKDLIKAFDMSVDYVRDVPASVKIDGVNASVRLVILDNKKQFVLDRGSNKPLDVKGITKSDLLDRFGEGHGFLRIGEEVLDIFNSGLATCTPSLKKLGLYDNPNILFNIEYVEGKTNVKSYNNNFLAIHGLLEISQVTPKRRGATEIKYDEGDLMDFLNALQPHASTHGFEVVGSIPTTLSKTPNLNKILNEKITYTLFGEKMVFTLKDKLNKLTIPTGSFTTLEGKKVDYLSKNVLQNVLRIIEDGSDITNYCDVRDVNKVMDGFVIYYYTMKAGEEILNSLDSKLGPVGEQEGIVIRDPNISDVPYKITGKFILDGIASDFK